MVHNTGGHWPFSQLIHGRIKGRMRDPAIGNWLLAFGQGWWCKRFGLKEELFSVVDQSRFRVKFDAIWSQFDRIRGQLNTESPGLNAITPLES